MEYQNNLMPFVQTNSFGEGKRIHPILQHYAWIEYGKKQALDFTSLSEPLTKRALGLTPSELSQLCDIDKDNLRDRLLNLELIFFALEEEMVEKTIADKNIQAINESYEAVIKSRHISRRAA